MVILTQHAGIARNPHVNEGIHTPTSHCMNRTNFSSVCLLDLGLSLVPSVLTIQPWLAALLVQLCPTGPSV